MLVRHPRTSVRPSPIDPTPASPLERNPLSPKGWKNRDSGGIGLGIVAALNKSGVGDAPAKTIIVAAPNMHVSAPVAIASPRSARCRGSSEESKVGCRDVRWRGAGSPERSTEEIPPAFPIADFLNHCNLCSKRLDGKDIYIYRGEKAFCSIECRYRQIVSDEFQENCGSGIPKPADISSSPYAGGGRLFFTAVAAT